MLTLTKNAVELYPASTMQAFRAVGKNGTTSYSTTERWRFQQYVFLFSNGLVALTLTLQLAPYGIRMIQRRLASSNLGVDFPSTDHLTFPATKINDHEVETRLLSAEARRGRKATGFFKVLVIRVDRINRNPKACHGGFAQRASLPPLPP